MNFFLKKKDNKSLWTALINGSEEAYTKIWNEYRRRCYLDALYWLRDSCDADDIVQEVFTRLWAGREALPLNANIQSYLQAMVKNACIDYRRRKKSKPTEYRQEDQLPVQVVHHDHLVSRETVQIIDDAIASLPPAQRKVVEQKFRTLRHKEIARRTGKSAQTIRNQLAAANKTLRKKLYFLKRD